MRVSRVLQFVIGLGLGGVVMWTREWSQWSHVMQVQETVFSAVESIMMRAVEREPLQAARLLMRFMAADPAFAAMPSDVATLSDRELINLKHAILDAIMYP
jgi:hypothetical protein